MLYNISPETQQLMKIAFTSCSHICGLVGATPPHVFQAGWTMASCDMFFFRKRWDALSGQAEVCNVSLVFTLNSKKSLPLTYYWVRKVHQNPWYECARKQILLMRNKCDCVKECLLARSCSMLSTLSRGVDSVLPSVVCMSVMCVLYLPTTLWMSSGKNPCAATPSTSPPVSL